MTKTSNPKVILSEARTALSQQMRDMMLASSDAIIDACPIKTGHLLSNFILATDSPHSTVEGSRRAVSYAAQEAGVTKVEAYDLAKDGAKIFLTNNVFYLRFQRPFIAEALARATPGLRKSRVFRAMATAAHRRAK